jgi:hypothetical protein
VSLQLVLRLPEQSFICVLAVVKEQSELQRRRALKGLFLFVGNTYVMNLRKDILKPCVCEECNKPGVLSETLLGWCHCYVERMRRSKCCVTKGNREVRVASHRTSYIKGGLWSLFRTYSRHLVNEKGEVL